MALPKINVPIYETTLYSINKKIKYRPYLVKEKKILMIAYESKDPNAAYLAVKQIVNNCTMGDIDVEKLALFDLQNLFLKIRSKSVGEEVEFGFECPNCKNLIKNSINFDNINIKVDPSHTQKIQLTDTIGIVMKYPTIFIEKIFDNNQNTKLLDLKIITNRIDYIYDNEEIYKAIPEKELDAFVESLTESQLQKIEKFFETMPKMEYKIDYKCNSCQNEGKYEVKDFYSFFD